MQIPALVPAYQESYDVNFVGNAECHSVVFHDNRMEALSLKSGMQVNVTNSDLCKCVSDLIVILMDCTGNILNSAYKDMFGAAIYTRVKTYVRQNHNGYLPVGKAFLMNMTAFSDSYKRMMCVAVCQYDLSVFNTVILVLQFIKTQKLSVTFPDLEILGLGTFRTALQCRVAVDTFMGYGVNRDNPKNLLDTMRTVRNINNIKLIYPDC